MSAMNTPGDRSYDEVRKAWQAATHPAACGRTSSRTRRATAVRARISGNGMCCGRRSHEAAKITDPAAVERRVLQLVDPEATGPAAGTTTNLSANLQILLPGEAARPHRHTMNALRFVMEGKGAYTIVDGKSCLMEEGDLVITPGWTWHEHVHKGTGPIVWMDALDAPLHRYLGTDVFEPGPTHDVPELRRRHAPSRCRTSCRTWTPRAAVLAGVPLSVGAGSRRGARRRPPARTARGACATSIRSTAGRRCRSWIAT